jgi:hypothetical protein
MTVHYDGYENLLQELLMCLAGFNGDVFVEKAEGYYCSLFNHKNTYVTTIPYFQLRLVLSDDIPSPDQGTLELAKDVSWVEDPDRCQPLFSMATILNSADRPSAAQLLLSFHLWQDRFELSGIPRVSF